MARPVHDDSLFWTKLRTEEFRSEWLETDLYGVTQTAMEDYIAGNFTTSSHILQKIATSGEPARLRVFDIFLTLCLSDGQQAIYEKMIKVLHTPKVTNIEAHYQLLEFSIKIFRKDSQDKVQLKLMRSVEVHPSMSKLLESNKKEYQKTAREFLMCFTNREWNAMFFPIRFHFALQPAYTYCMDTQMSSGLSHFRLIASV